MPELCSINTETFSSPTEGPFFSEEALISLKTRPLPSHIAVIPDGNRRWAKKHSVPSVNGYLEGTQAIIRTARAAKELGIPVLTVYSFSTENNSRSPEETSVLMQLTDIHLKFYETFLIESRIRLHVIGDITQLPEFLQETIGQVSLNTSSGTDLDLVLAMNYGGRDELVRAFRKLAALHRNDDLRNISEESVSQALDTYRWPDPDLIIRTGGEYRISNFLLWQSSYAEVYIEDDFWPDFSPEHLRQATISYQNRQRRRGG